MSKERACGCPHCYCPGDDPIAPPGQTNRESGPRGGDIVICAFCAGINRYTDDGEVRRCEPDELREIIIAHPEIDEWRIHLIQQARRLISRTVVVELEKKMR